MTNLESVRNLKRHLKLALEIVSTMDTRGGDNPGSCHHSEGGRYLGSMPCTGRYVCVGCGIDLPDPTPR